MYASVGISNEEAENETGNGYDASDDQRRMLIALFVFFGMIIGWTIYLLVCKRVSPSVANDISRRYNVRLDGLMKDVHEEEMLDFI